MTVVEPPPAAELLLLAHVLVHALLLLAPDAPVAKLLPGVRLLLPLPLVRMGVR